MDSAPPRDVLYLAGVSYCGSTLLSFLLNAHPQIFSIGEMGPYAPFESEEYRCSCGAKLIECPFILAVKDLMENKYHLPFDTRHWDLRHERRMGRLETLILTRSFSSPALNSICDIVRSLIPSYRKLMRAYGFRNEAFIRAALEISGKRVFLDATKSYMRIPLFQKISGLNMKVLHLVRDPRGYCFSALRRHGKSSLMASQDWVKTNDQIDNTLRRLGPHQWIRLKYEVLCLEPEKTLARLASFIGVESSAALTDGFGEKEHHIIGNNMRLRSDALRSVKLDERWRDTLSLDDLKIIRSTAGEHAHKYGYDI